MIEKLSQEAIDEINSGLPRKVKIYDFWRPDKFSKEQILSMQNIHETFARLSTTTLSAAMHVLAHAHVASVDQLTYEEFIRSIPSPTTIAVIDMEPLKGRAVLEMDPSVVFPIIDRLLGGSGQGAALARELTDIERSIMEGVIVRLLGNFREAWSWILDLRPRLAQIETNPQFAQIVPPSEMVCLVTIETRIGEAEGMMNLAFPYMTIEPIIPKLSAQFWYSAARRSPTNESMQALMGHIEGLDVAAEVLIEGERLRLRELGNLKMGSLVRLPGLDRGEASLRMGGRSLFRMKALPRVRGNAQAYEIVEKPAEEALPSAEPMELKGESSEIAIEFRSALEDFRSGIGASLSGIASGLAALSRKQDEMTDQLALGPSEREEAEEGRLPERKRPFDFIRRVDPEHVLNFIQVEHPQTIALVLSYLEPQAAALILGRLPLELQPEVARKIACMGRTMPDVLREVERVLEKKLSVQASEEYAEAGGVEGIVEILNMADRSTERHIVESLENRDPELAEDIKKRMFVFEDVVLLDRAAVVKLVKRIDVELLLRAMKAAPEEVKLFVWNCLPSAESEGLKARLEALGRVRLNEVDAAQQKIVAAIRAMEESGEIVLARPEETVE